MKSKTLSCRRLQFGWIQFVSHARLVRLVVVYVWFLSLVVYTVPANRAAAQQSSAGKKQEVTASGTSKPLAFVGQQPITEAEVNLQLGRDPQLQLPTLSESARNNVVHLVAMQRQALQTMRRLKLAADRDEVVQYLERAAADRPDAISAEFLMEEAENRFGVEREAFLDQVAFRLSWKSYLAKHLTNENIHRHFTNQKARFDGTRFQIWVVSARTRVGHSEERTQRHQALREIIATLPKSPTEESLRECVSEEVWGLSYGDWVSGTGDLPPAAIDQLLELETGQISKTFDTPDGVHILGLLKREPGELRVEDVQAEVRAHMLSFLLDHLAAQSKEQLPLRAANQSARDAITGD